MDFFVSQIDKYQWFINGLLVIFLLWLSDALLGLNPINVFRILIHEFKDLVNRNWTSGAVNALSLVTVFFLGLIFVVLDSANELFYWIRGIMGDDKAREYAASVDPSIVFLCLVILAAFSIAFVSYGSRPSVHDH